jgi:DNA-binding FadR family transcriptional regulator
MVDVLGRSIVTGEYEGRRFPTEAELAVQHGVSRSVTREAVKMLTSKGLLSARPRQGTIVQPARTWNLFDTSVLGWLLNRKFSLELLRRFNELRLGIEPVASKLAADRGDVPAIAAIRAGFDRMVAAEAGEDNPLEADIAFHAAVLRASGNPFYEQFEELVSTALRSSIRFTNRFKGRSADLNAHGEVLHFIKMSDGASASTAMTLIITDVLALIDTSERGSAEPSSGT